MRMFVAIAGLLVSAPAAAEVVGAHPAGFHLRYSTTLKGSPDAAFASFTKIERWWDPDHTYGGKASGLSLKAEPGGCFCETLPKGGIEHMRVAYVDGGKRLLMTGGLGPLLFEATSGVMDVQFEPVPGGTKATMTYKVSGFAERNAEKLAPLVDKVMAHQWNRFTAAAAKP